MCVGVFVTLQKINDLISKMVDIDNNMLNAKTVEIRNVSLKQGFAIDNCQCLGMMLGKGFQPCPQTCGEEHCFDGLHIHFVDGARVLH